ncbi:MAG: acetoin utilization protein AcuC [Armatimonadota bacterium]
MLPRAALIYSPKFSDYDLGPSHPLKPIRVERTHELIKACGLLRGSKVSVVAPTPADDDTIALVHSRGYIDAVKAAGAGRVGRRFYDYGLGTIDNPIIEGMYEAAALIAGGTVAAADLVVDGKADVAFNPGGGLHHAHQSRASGFCIFNDPAIAIAHVLRKCGEGVKVVYIDIDAHHGDGVQEAFCTRKDVLTISVHESGRYLFPTTGNADEIGTGDGRGYSVNLPLSPFTGDDVYLWAFKEIVPPLLEAYQPDFICTQLGVDTHYQDPLTHLCCTTRGYLAVVNEIAMRAPKWIATGGGGYDVTVVPRAWTLAFGRMTGKKVPQFIPEEQADPYRPARRGNASGEAQGIPLHDTNGPKIDDDWLRVSRQFAEQSVAEIKQRVFPYHGL